MNIWRHGAPDENSHSAAVCNPSISWGSTFTEWADEVLMQYNTYFNLKSNSDKNDNLREREEKALFLTSLHTSNCVCGNHRKQEFLNSFCEEKHSALLFFSYLLLVLKIAFFLYFFSFFSLWRNTLCAILYCPYFTSTNNGRKILMLLFAIFLQCWFFVHQKFLSQVRKI